MIGSHGLSLEVNHGVQTLVPRPRGGASPTAAEPCLQGSAILKAQLFELKGLFRGKPSENDHAFLAYAELEIIDHLAETAPVGRGSK